jgi:hypothetical protein
VTDVVGPSDIPHRLAFVAPPDGLADLVRGEWDDQGIVGQVMFGIFLDVSVRRLAEEARE